MVRTLSRRQRAAASGFTLTEVLVALVVLGVGVLALARTLTALEGLERSAERRWAAAAVLQARLERMRTEPCAARSGVDRAPGVLARWSVTPDSGLGILADTASIAGNGAAPVNVGVRSAAPC